MPTAKLYVGGLVKYIYYPFIETYLSFMEPELTCMICGYYDTKTVFHPLHKKTTKTAHRRGTTTIDIKLPLPGSRDENLIRCPMCLAKDERSLGNKIWNLL